jgi:hypothetical protein
MDMDMDILGAIIIGILIGIIIILVTMFAMSPNNTISSKLENTDVNGKYVYVYNDNSIIDSLNSFYDFEDFDYWLISKSNLDNTYDVTLHFQNCSYEETYKIKYDTIEDMISKVNNIREKGFE